MALVTQSPIQEKPVKRSFKSWWKFWTTERREFLIQREIELESRVVFLEEHLEIQEEKLKGCENKLESILNYCAPYFHMVWAAKIGGLIMDCDFRDCEEVYKKRRESK